MFPLTFDFISIKLGSYPGCPGDCLELLIAITNDRAEGKEKEEGEREREREREIDR